VPDPSSCRVHETPIDLGGPTHGYAIGDAGDATFSSPTSVTILKLGLPAGKYLLHAKTDESVKCRAATSGVESGRARVTPDRRAGRGDGSPAAQDCRLTTSESHPSGGTRARSLRCFGFPVGDELPVGALGLLAQSAFSGPHLLQVVGVGGAALAAA
jgi:hypothetical protein